MAQLLFLSGGGGSGARGPVRTLVFTNEPVLPTEVDTFNNWLDLYAVWQTISVPKQIALKQDQATFAITSIPPGTYDMKGMCFINANAIGSQCLLELGDGVVLHDLGGLDIGVSVAGNSNTGPCLTFSLKPGGSPSIFKIAVGGNLWNFSTTFPLIQWDRDTALGQLIFGLLGSGGFANTGTPGAKAVVDVTPSGAFPSVVALYSFFGHIDQDTISGSNAGGQAVFSINAFDGQYVLDQPSWAGAPLADPSLFSVQSRPRVNIQTPPLPSGAIYNVQNGSEHVRCAPTGAGDIAIVLPDPKLCPDETVTVKRETPDVADAINVSDSSGGSIDGVFVYPLPATPFSVSHFRSDGSKWGAV